MPKGIYPRPPKPPCAAEGCEEPNKTGGYCSTHSWRVAHWGDPRPDIPIYSTVPFIARFWSKVDRRGDDECWPWLGPFKGGGYGQAPTYGGQRTGAHRVAYELLVGPIPEGLELDHLCRNPPCVNPSHLEPVTHKENGLRGNSPMAREARQTHCIRGHEFTEDNIYRQPSKPTHRRCRICDKERDQRRDRRRNKT